MNTVQSEDTLPSEIEARIERRGRAATIYDIAELAGVNPSTVSRALNQPGRVSPTTEARIRAAAERLNFRLNPMARALPTGRTRTIALVVADITNPVVFGIVRGAEHAASAAGYTLVIAESQESGTAETKVIARLQQSVDGFILATTRLTDAEIAELAQRKSVVLINRPADGVPSVLPDIDAGVSEMLAHLSGLGHRSIIYLSGPENSWISGRRWERMLEAAEHLGLALAEVGPNPPTLDGGRSTLRRVQASRATAVVAFNDLMAIGLIQAAKAADVRVPLDLSVAGFDNIFGSDFIVPALTTVGAQLLRAGERAVQKLIGQVDGTALSADDEVLGTTLVVRASTGSARS